MLTIIKLLLVAGAALLGVWLFEHLRSWMIEVDSPWFGISISTDTRYSTDTRQLYTFSYLVIFALAGVFRWPIAAKRRVVASGIVLLGGILPLLAVLVRWYLGAHWPLSEIFDASERIALFTLLVAHGVALAVANALLLLTSMKRPMLPQHAGS